jgi:probable addiction module antidote protein
VQKYFHDAVYDKVRVFCSGATARNNLGNWQIRDIDAPNGSNGFQFHAAKDRAMAREADFGLMIWDGKSPGTILNVLRLMRAGKIAVLFNVPDQRAINIKTASDWAGFLQHCGSELLQDLRKRATPEEWGAQNQADLLDAPSAAVVAEPSESELAESLNAALAAADPSAVVNALGSLAKIHGMSNVAKETGLARESLYRALGSEGNPEFATVLKVLSSLGLRLRAGRAQTT